MHHQVSDMAALSVQSRHMQSGVAMLRDKQRRRKKKIYTYNS
jgi:hypothetical protein